MGVRLNDDINSKYFDIGATSDYVDDSPFNTSDMCDVLFESLYKPMYDNCKYFSVLSAVVRLMNIKVTNKITDKSFDDILKILKEDITRK